jgi:integrase
VAAWKARLHRTTVHQYRQGLLKLVKHIAALSGRSDLPGQIPRVAPALPRKIIAQPEELARLLEAAPGWLRCAMLLASHSGFRRSDVIRIAPEHFSAEHRTLTIEQQKTGHTVTVPVTDALFQSLTNAPHGNPQTPFLELYRGKPVGKVMLWSAWATLKKKTQTNKELTFHDLRRTIAVGLYEVSKDLRVVEQMLGHKSLSSTIRYLEHRDASKLRPYLDQLFKPTTGAVQ